MDHRGHDSRQSHGGELGAYSMSVVAVLHWFVMSSSYYIGEQISALLIDRFAQITARRIVIKCNKSGRKNASRICVANIRE